MYCLEPICEGAFRVKAVINGVTVEADAKVLSDILRGLIFRPRPMKVIMSTAKWDGEK